MSESIFDSEFYPTPKELGKDIVKMVLKGLDPLKQQYFNVLDPSAGKGDLLDAFKESVNDFDFLSEIVDDICDEFDDEQEKKRFIRSLISHNKFKYHAIEIMPEMQMVLTGKGYKVIDQNFLKFNTMRNYDIILMNPPFSNGVDHLLKAWDVSQGGRIICILNAESLRNLSDSKRILLQKIIADHDGVVEYRTHAFSNAERTTDVDIAIISLTKPAKEDFSFEFKGNRVNTDIDINEENLMNQITRNDIIGNWITALENSIGSFKEVLEKYAEWEFYMNVLKPTGSSVNTDSYPVVGKALASMKAEKESYVDAIDEMTSMAWDKFFSVSKIENIMTSSVRKTFHAQAKDKGYLSFTRENVEQVIDSLIISKGSIMDQCILESFEYLTKYHDENRVHIEGWKTNDAYKVNKKVILPNIIDTWFDRCTVQWRVAENIRDLDKGLCYLDGRKSPEPGMGLLTRLEEECKNHAFGKWHDSHFFRFKFYKKQTLHIEFKNKQLWEMFNETAAKGKNWLPEEANRSRNHFHDSDEVSSSGPCTAVA